MRNMSVSTLHKGDYDDNNNNNNNKINNLNWSISRPSIKIQFWYYNL